MKTLFVYRHYGPKLANSVIDFQRNSLEQSGIEIDCFFIARGGLSSYIKAIVQLNRYLKKNTCDIVHAHYSFCGIISALATRKPVVCSLMGSDILQQGPFFHLLTRVFSKYFWKATIVKNSAVNEILPKSNLIPNGVDFSNFKEIEKQLAIQHTGFLPTAKNIVFIAQDYNSKVKNQQLAKRAIYLTGNANIVLHLLSGKSFEELPYYYNAADLLLLTSLTEGSPNVIKEAMACNTPIVTVNVGDVQQVIGNTRGTWICAHNAEEIAVAINNALEYGKKTLGREKIQHLDNTIIAQKIIEVYKRCLG